jgi:hypothetical protein
MSQTRTRRGDLCAAMTYGEVDLPIAASSTLTSLFISVGKSAALSSLLCV